jgi:fluoroquinolone resistance protein
MKTELNKLTDRWASGIWHEQFVQLLADWQDGHQNINNFSFPKIDGKWDLRGINLSALGSWVPNEVKLSNGMRVSILRGPNLIYRGLKFNDIDLSYSNLNGATFENCSFINVSFQHADGSRINDKGTSFYNVDFSKAKWRGATLGLGGARYEKCKFIGTDLTNVFCYRGYFIDCRFEKAKLENIDFEASHFIRCIFIGNLQSVWFRGYYPIQAHEDSFGITEKNTMEDVDFSKANFWDVMFTTNCDLSKTIPPDDGEHLFFKNWPLAKRVAIEIIEKEWKGHYRDRGINRIAQKQDNPMYIVSLHFERDMIIKHYPDPETINDYLEKYCNLLIEVAEITNG